MIKKPSEWEFHILQGNLEFADSTYANPLLYINAFNELYSHVPYEDHQLDYCAIHLPTKIAVTQLWGKRYIDQQDSFAIGDLSSFASLNETEKKSMLKKAVAVLHKKITKLNSEAAFESGATVSLAIINKNKIYTTNLGDSVSYLCIIKSNQVESLTLLNKKLHRAGDQTEILRIEKFLKKCKYAADQITSITERMHDLFDPRLGPLAITAALGDTAYDEIGMLHIPDDVNVTTVNLAKQSKALLIAATDGLTETLDHADLIKVINENIRANPLQLSQILAQKAFDTGSTDNITVLVKPLDVKEKEVIYMAVFDGHGGNKVARMGAELLGPLLRQLIEH